MALDNSDEDENLENEFDPNSEEWKTSKRRPRKSNRKKTNSQNENDVIAPVTMPEITSKIADPTLAKIVTLIYIALVEIKKIAPKDLLLEENRHRENFIYHFENKKLNLVGYLGRNKDNPDYLVFVVMDRSRFHWAQLEGFVAPNKDGVLDIKERQFVFENIGVFREVNNFNDFINFLSKSGEYKFKGDYIKS